MDASMHPIHLQKGRNPHSTRSPPGPCLQLFRLHPRTDSGSGRGGGWSGVELQAKDFTATARLSLTRSSQYAISCLVEEFKGFLCFAGLGRNLGNSSNNWLCLSRIDPGYFLHWPGDLCRTPLDEKEVIQELLSRSNVLCERVQREG